MGNALAPFTAFLPRLVTLAALLLPAFSGLGACTTTTVDTNALQADKIRTIAIAIGSDTRGRAAVIGPIFPTTIYAPLSADLDKRLNRMALEQLENALASKGYKHKRLKTVPLHWDLYANIPDSSESYGNLLRQFDIQAGTETADAILFVEFMLQPKAWGADQIGALTLDTYETMHAKSKVWIYDPHTGKRLFFSIVQRGYDQALTHVSPSEAFKDILGLEGMPPVGQ